MPLVNTYDMLKKAYDGGYAIGAFNVNNMEILQGISDACNELRSPVIVQASAGAIKYAGIDYIRALVKTASQLSDVPMALHLDHGPDFDTCKACIDNGFTSVMIDASSLPYEQNIALTKKVVDYAHKYNVTVEAELGTLAGIEDDVNVDSKDALYTDPTQVQDFVSKTCVDSLAIAIGTSHGAYKFKQGQKPQLRFDILEEVSKLLPSFPIVLHGASSVSPEYVNMINKFGGNMPGATGIPEDMLRKAARLAVCKINIDSDLRLAFTATIRKFLSENLDIFDPRAYLKPARNAIKEVVSHKITSVLGSHNKF